MRIRTIKPEFFLHEGLYELEAETKLPIRLAFAGLWCAADREGRFKWEPRKIGVQVLPYDGIDFSRVLDALTTRGFVVKYASPAGEFGYIPSFTKHQVINNRERESELPNPLSAMLLDACSTREPRVPHAGKAEGKGREGNMDVPPTPQGGDGEGELPGMPPPQDPPPKADRCLPDGWRKLKDTQKKRTRVNFNTPTMILVGQALGRKESTLWTVQEAEALLNLKPAQDEIDAILDFYAADIPTEKDWRRRDLLTLLNNWNGELDKARLWKAEQRQRASA